MSQIHLEIDEEVIPVSIDSDLRAAQSEDLWIVVDVSNVGGSTTEDGQSIPIDQTDIVKSGFKTPQEAKLFIQRLRIAKEHFHVNVNAIRTRLKVLDEQLRKAHKLASECAGYAINSGEISVANVAYKDLERLHKQLLEQHVLLSKLLIEVGE